MTLVLYKFTILEFDQYRDLVDIASHIMVLIPITFNYLKSSSFRHTLYTVMVVSMCTHGMQCICRFFSRFVIV